MISQPRVVMSASRASDQQATAVTHRQTPRSYGEEEEGLQQKQTQQEQQRGPRGQYKEKDKE